MWRKSLKEKLLNKRMILDGHWINPDHLGERYSRVWFKGKFLLAHRASAEVFLGLDPNSSFLVCHKCDESRCFNPEHLYIGTQSTNAKDTFKSGRRVRNQNMKEAAFVKKEYEET